MGSCCSKVEIDTVTKNQSRKAKGKEVVKSVSAATAFDIPSNVDMTESQKKKSQLSDQGQVLKQKENNAKESGKKFEPYATFEIPVRTESQTMNKKFPVLSSQKRKRMEQTSHNQDQLRNYREIQLNAKMKKAEQNKKGIIQNKQEMRKSTDEKIRIANARKNSTANAIWYPVYSKNNITN
eukprot:NODE_196_length_15381_cov_0.267243.p5 type:complete len:181 gc:universal NODE_196_length_15381_cov_0.267243:7862-8404(+)